MTIDGEDFIDIDYPINNSGCLLSVRCSKVGNKILIFCHGLGSNKSVWSGVASTLMKCGYCIISVDMRKHGASLCQGDAIDKYGLEQNAKDLSDVFMHLASTVLHNETGAERRAIVVGHSYGAQVALMLSILRPDLVSGVACIDGGFIDLQKKYPDFADCLLAFQTPLYRDVKWSVFEYMVRREWCRGWPEEGVQSMLSNFVQKNVIASHDRYVVIEPRLESQTYMKLLHNMWQSRPQAWLPRVRVPVMFLLAGSPCDCTASIFSFDKSRDVAEAVRLLAGTSHVEWFADSGHDMPAQCPQQTAQALQRAIENGFFGDASIKL